MTHFGDVAQDLCVLRFGVGDLNIGSTTASLSRSSNGINIDARRLVNIDDDH